MIVTIVLAAILWAAFVLLSLWLVSKIARTGIADSRRDLRVKFTWNPRRNTGTPRKRENSIADKDARDDVSELRM